MISKRQIKFIHSLKHKKYRIHHKCFVAEGNRTIQAILDSGLNPIHVFLTEPKNHLAIDLRKKKINYTLLKKDTLKSISFLHSTGTSLAIFPLKMQTKIKMDKDKWYVALDDLNDPGNMGTIIRLCHWFGVHGLVCNTKSVDAFNPKVVQSSMGSIASMTIFSTPLDSFLSSCSLPIYAASSCALTQLQTIRTEPNMGGILLLGNEARGISRAVIRHAHYTFTISKFTPTPVDSLNVASAGRYLPMAFYGFWKSLVSLIFKKSF